MAEFVTGTLSADECRASQTGRGIARATAASGRGGFGSNGKQSMIRFGVLGTARVVPYGLLAPAKETHASK
jgi:hypothetical protein